MRRSTSLPRIAPVAGIVSAERDELKHLIEKLSDDQVPAVLAEARRQGAITTVCSPRASGAPE